MQLSLIVQLRVGGTLSCDPTFHPTDGLDSTSGSQINENGKTHPVCPHSGDSVRHQHHEPRGSGRGHRGGGLRRGRSGRTTDASSGNISSGNGTSIAASTTSRGGGTVNRDGPGNRRGGGSGSGGGGRGGRGEHAVGGGRGDRYKDGGSGGSSGGAGGGSAGGAAGSSSNAPSGNFSGSGSAGRGNSSSGGGSEGGSGGGGGCGGPCQSDSAGTQHAGSVSYNQRKLGSDHMSAITTSPTLSVANINTAPRRPLTAIPKENISDGNDAEEWETASEGTSDGDRGNSVISPDQPSSSIGSYSVLQLNPATPDGLSISLIHQNASLTPASSIVLTGANNTPSSTPSSNTTTPTNIKGSQPTDVLISATEIEVDEPVSSIPIQSPGTPTSSKLCVQVSPALPSPVYCRNEADSDVCRQPMAPAPALLEIVPSGGSSSSCTSSSSSSLSTSSSSGGETTRCQLSDRRNNDPCNNHKGRRGGSGSGGAGGWCTSIENKIDPAI
ncbi:unnamed protein product [Protopolystoma xenopodis]|uniref:Uncharacterized protein n=1 Tax=Protopolystoma xenopodis TaxID=117903 RepID=A0A448XFS3_9PLAT|nr:unnamed protein product [Protopolystoma xenopodis]